MSNEFSLVTMTCVPCPGIPSRVHRPSQVQALARQQNSLLRENPFHSLQLLVRPVHLVWEYLEYTKLVEELKRQSPVLYVRDENEMDLSQSLSDHSTLAPRQDEEKTITEGNIKLGVFHLVPRAMITVYM